MRRLPARRRCAIDVTATAREPMLWRAVAVPSLDSLEAVQ
jgi:hypothetical protein